MKNGAFFRCSTLIPLFVVVAFRLTAGSLELVSTKDPAITPSASANGDSGLVVISPDGRFVLFASSANDLPVTTNGAAMTALFPPRLNVFLRDRTNVSTTLVSVNLAGTGGGNGDSMPAGLSTNGRYALLECAASDLFADDTNSASDVFVRDLVAGTTTLVSASTNGGLGNDASRSAVMTPDGRYVAFVSAANNLVPDDTNGISDVFLRDLQASTTTLVSVGAKTANRSSESPEITPDGRYVAFYSSATGLMPGTTNYGDIYVRDVVADTTVWASVGARAALQLVQNKFNAVSFSHSISEDGQFVAYEVGQTPTTYSGIILRYNIASGLTDLVHSNAAVAAIAVEDARNPAMTPDGRFIAFVANVGVGVVTNTCVQVWDAQTGTNVLASVGLEGTVSTNSICDWPTITPDGRYVAFTSTATNLVGNSLVGEYHLYLRDLQASTTALVDVDANGVGLEVTPMSFTRLSADGRFGAFEAPDGGRVAGDDNHSTDIFMRDLALNVTELISARQPTLPSVTPHGSSLLYPMSVSGNGRCLAFASEADNLVADDTNGFRDVFLRDLNTGTNILVSVDSNGIAPANGFSYGPSLSSDGRYVAFTSSADNLLPDDTNNVQDVFVRDLQTGTTVLASVNLNGFSGNRASHSPTLSADGQAVLFHSTASDLAVGSFGTTADNLFWRDLLLNITYPVSTNTSGPAMLPAAMTPNGRYIALGSSTSTILYIWDTQLRAQIYSKTVPLALTEVGISPDGNRIAHVSNNAILHVVDQAAGTTVQLTTNASRSPHFSADGRFLAYQTANAKVVSDTNGLADIYLYDFQTSSNRLVSCALSGSANGASDSPDISADGRFVAYRSAASNLVPNDGSGFPDVFVWDRITGATLLLSASRSSNTPADNRSLTPVFSGDGQTVAFASAASDLIAGDFNRWNDVFAYSLVSTDSIPVFQAAIVRGMTVAQGWWLTWPVVSGKSYRVQFKDNLADPDWQNFSSGVAIIGSQGWLNDLTPGVDQRFYRVVAE
jgi:Tol biopolymer transport system component